MSPVSVDGFFARLLSLVHLGTTMNWLSFGVKCSNVEVTLSWRRRRVRDVNG